MCPGKSSVVGMVWLATTAVGVLSAWLAMRPVLAAALPDDVAALPVAAAPSRTPVDSATRRAEPGTLDGWYEIKDGVWEQGFHTDGGSATIRVSAEEITLVSATPRDGFAVLVDDEEEGRLVVRFNEGPTVYTVDALWWHGGPYATVEASG